MAGIFISYRREPAVSWAGRLFADLCECFGASQVFMDINGGIPGGSIFDLAITKALSTCDVLLALIHKEWVSCKHADDRRRLDDPNDWVRREIASALRWNRPIILVLLGGAQLPKEEELPDEIRSLCKYQTREISDTRWNYDFNELVKDLVRLPGLKPLEGDDIASTNTGLRLLLELNKNPAVADVVSRSREVFENTYRQTVKLELFKTIHDALHNIEFDCVRVIEEGKATNPLRPMKINFATQARSIRQAFESKHMDSYPSLRTAVEDRLKSVDTTFQGAVDAPGDAVSYEQLKGELNTLLSLLPPLVNVRIVTAAEDLNLNRLVELMNKVQEQASTASLGDDPKLKPFLQGIDALQRLRDELSRRVNEHAQLQGLDSKLRTVCNAKTPPGELAKEWGRIKTERSRLLPPFFPELEEANKDLIALEADVETTVAGGDGPAALDSMRAYCHAIATVFRAEDTSLKNFCSRLSEVSQPLKAILEG
ncbi:MAG: TIR domain-containing protein [Nitrospirota bacterium]